MPQLRIALAQVNSCVGDLAANSRMVLDWARKSVEDGAHVVTFPEMVLAGYPVEDLALRKSFAAACRAEVDDLARRLAESGCGDALIVIGYLDHDEHGPRNAAALVHRGEVIARYAKHHLPNYGVFDEFRHFAPGRRLPVVHFHGVDLGVVICEDIWQDSGPVAALGEIGVDVILALNASPYERRKDDVRAELVRRRSAEAGAPMAYVNLVGGQDELVFDGDSLVVAEGRVLARAPQFTEHLLVTDMTLGGHTASTDSGAAIEREGFEVRRISADPDSVPAYEPRTPVVAEPFDDLAEVWSALVTGLRDYAHKNGFRSVMFGFSGGIDSSVSAALTADALGASALYGVSMPSKYSSEHSRSDAAELAERIGCHYEVLPVGDMVEIFVNQLDLSGLAEENIQSRCRGMTLMALSNKHGHLVLAPGNKTELAVGYSTIYGDAVGGFAPIKDVPKTLVWELARWRNAEAEKRGEQPPIPENSIVKAPSAELRPGQVDTDSLPPYHLLDEVLDGYIEGDRGYADLIESGFDPALVERVTQLVDQAEYKRRQYPTGTKITFKAFGRDRRLPMTNRWREVRSPDESDG